MKQLELEVLFLSHEDILSLRLTRKDVLGFVEESFVEHGKGFYCNPKKPAIHPLDDAFVHAMPGFLPRKHALGIKWVSGFSGNVKKNLPAITGLIVINDVENGFPVAIMDCSWITAQRTAAASAVAAKYLANPSSSVVGVVGAGVQGREHVLAMQDVLPGIRKVKVYDLNPDLVEALIAAVSGSVPYEVVKAESAREALEDADVAITATGKLSEPIFSKSWIKPGSLVMPVHTAGWDRDLPFVVDKFIVDDWQQFSQTHAVPDGYYKKLPLPYAELGEIVIGKKRGRYHENERILAHNLGIAIHDMIMAKKILDLVREKKIGKTLYLMGEPSKVVSSN